MTLLSGFSGGKKIMVLLGVAFLLASCSATPKITWNDTSWCTPWSLKYVLRRAARKFGRISVHSTHRWPLENRRKGGKRKSFHLKCRAVDFSIPGNPRDVIRFLKSHRQVGGYSYYRQGFYHIDNGPRRTW